VCSSRYTSTEVSLLDKTANFKSYQDESCTQVGERGLQVMNLSAVAYQMQHISHFYYFILLLLQILQLLVTQLVFVFCLTSFRNAFFLS
jgi:hypothetical protein